MLRITTTSPAGAQIAIRELQSPRGPKLLCFEGWALLHPGVTTLSLRCCPVVEKPLQLSVTPWSGKHGGETLDVLFELTQEVIGS